MEATETLRRARDFWNRHARWNHRVAIYDTEEVRDPRTSAAAYDAAGAEDARRLRWFAGRDTRALDLGCGAGRVLAHLAPHVREVVGVDVSDDMLALARRALEQTPNARLVPTSGAALAGVASGSIGFVYSLLCLIHVDRRSAYRYLREIRRVLEPDGLALLQFQSIVAPEGLAKFQRVLESDYPLEFYTAEELRHLAASTGLETLSVHASAEYLFVTLLAGERSRWIAKVSAGTRLYDVEGEGAFASERVDLSQPGRVRARARLDAERPMAFRAVLALVPASGGGAPLCYGEAVVDLEPGREHALELLRDPAGGDVEGGTVRVRLDGREIEGAPPIELGPAARDAHLHVALLPPGFHLEVETQRLFPSLFVSRAVRVADQGVADQGVAAQGIAAQVAAGKP